MGFCPCTTVADLANFVPVNKWLFTSMAQIMNNISKFPTPPWDMDIAAERLKFEEAAWNSHDIDMILEGYTANAEIRDGLSFINGKSQLAAFLKKKLNEQPGYRVKLDLWGALKGRMAVRFEAEWHDAAGQWYRNYGVQVFQFTKEGLIEQRFASQEATAIKEGDRKLA